MYISAQISQETRYFFKNMSKFEKKRLQKTDMYFITNNVLLIYVILRKYYMVK